MPEQQVTESVCQTLGSDRERGRYRQGINTTATDRLVLVFDQVVE